MLAAFLHCWQGHASLLVCLGGKAYDVTEGARFYGPGSPYHQFAGRCCTRALALGSLERADLERGDDVADFTAAQRQYPRQARRRATGAGAPPWACRTGGRAQRRRAAARCWVWGASGSGDRVRTGGRTLGGSSAWGSGVWGTRDSGNRLGQPILDLGTWGLEAGGLEAGGLEAGGLEARATDFGSGPAHACP